MARGASELRARNSQGPGVRAGGVRPRPRGASYPRGCRRQGGSPGPGAGLASEAAGVFASPRGSSSDTPFTAPISPPPPRPAGPPRVPLLRPVSPPRLPLPCLPRCPCLPDPLPACSAPAPPPTLHPRPGGPSPVSPSSSSPSPPFSPPVYFAPFLSYDRMRRNAFTRNSDLFLSKCRSRLLKGAALIAFTCSCVNESLCVLGDLPARLGTTPGPRSLRPRPSGAARRAGPGLAWDPRTQPPGWTAAAPCHPSPARRALGGRRAGPLGPGLAGLGDALGSAPGPSVQACALQEASGCRQAHL